MQEMVAGEHRVAALNVPEPVAAELAAFSERVTGRSSIVWGEHCSECAYPACYSACDFYAPRPDLHCRRFEAGIERVSDRAGRGARLVRFRQWGKLEGRGPAPVRPVGRVEQSERLDAFASRVQAGAPLPFAVKRNLSWRWNERKQALASRGDACADAFVVEAWSGDGRTHALTLTFLEQDGSQRMHQVRFEAGPAYARIEISVAEIGRRIDLAGPFLIQIEPVGDAEGRAVVFGLTDFCTLRPGGVVGASEAVAPQALSPKVPAPRAKVLVWDLDETLWSGVLAEDGVAGVTPRPEAVEAIKTLDARGVLQSVASKNDPGEAARALQAFGLADYFLHPQVGWGPKSDAIARIATALDLSLDSFVFVDDQPFERAEVAAAHPAVRSLSHTEVAGLAAHAWFQHPATAESGRRRALYQAEALRAEALGTAQTDYLAFLRASGMRARLSALGPESVERIYELSQRTNQLNFTGAKFTREEVERRARPAPDRLALVVGCEDRFGDYGVIAFADLNLATGEIEAFFMSCRVQRKRVEHAVFGFMAERLRAAGHAQFRVRHRPTERNGASRALLLDLGFTEATEGLWTRLSDRPFEDADVARVELAGATLAEAA